MHAWPALRMKRSRSGHSVSRVDAHNVYRGDTRAARAPSRCPDGPRSPAARRPSRASDGVDRELVDVAIRHEAPRRVVAAVPVRNDMPLPAPPAGGTHRRAAPRALRARRSSVATAAPRSDASSTRDAVTGRASASAINCVHSESARRPPPVATTSSTSGRRSAIAAKRSATPSRPAWRMSRGVVRT